MAIYGCSLKIISRAPTPSRPRGRSIVDATAYCHRDSIKDLRQDRTFSYVREADDLVFSRLMAPAGTADPGTPAQFANLIEATEKRKDARLGRELQLSLPVELSREAQVELVTGFVRDHINAQQLVADVCIHEPPTMDGRGLNPHAHVLFSDRTWGPLGFGRKNRAINAKDWLIEIRQSWETSVNEALAREGHTQRVSCLTRAKQAELARAAGDEAKARELDTPPEPKLGPVLTKRLRNYHLRKAGQLKTPPRYGAVISESGRKLVDLWKGIREFRNRLKREAVQWAQETLFLQKAEAYLRVMKPVIERPVGFGKALSRLRKSAALVLRFEEVGARRAVRVRGARRKRLPDGAVLYRDARGRGLVLEEPGRITVLHEDMKAAQVAQALLNEKDVRGLRLGEGEQRNEVRSNPSPPEVAAARGRRARNALRALSGGRLDGERQRRAVLLPVHPAPHVRQHEPEAQEQDQDVRRLRGSDAGRTDGRERVLVERRDHVPEPPDVGAALAPDEVPTQVMEASELPEPSVIEVEAEMILEVAPEGQGVGLELGRAETEEPEPEPKLEVRPPAEPEAKLPEPPPPETPSTAEGEARKKKRRQRLEGTSRALREAERKRVLDAVKGGAKELELIAAKAKLSERVCKRRLGELEREGKLVQEGGVGWSMKSPSKGRGFGIGR